MWVKIGDGFELPLAGNHRVDFSIYGGNAFVKLTVDIWNNESSIALHSEEFRIFRWERLLGNRLAKKLVDRKFRKIIINLNKTISKLGIDDGIFISE